jgi:hypothetical protein
MSVWYQKQRERSAFPGETFYSAACVHCGELVQPVHGLKEANTRLATKQGYPTAYVATSVYDPGDNVDKPQADRWATRSITGSIVSDEEISMHRMCYNTDWWQQRIADICGTAVKDGGFKGIYLDTFGRWSRRCYAAEAHGHSLGGGRQGTRGMHLLAERVRERVRALDAETVMTAEASIEYFIDVLDGRLLSMSILPDHCPIFPAVYHDYTTFFGRTTVPFPDKPNLLRMKLANLFVMGAQLGRLFIHYDPPTLFAPERKDDLEYFRRLVSYKHAARKFLNLGKFLRPVKMLTTMPSISSKHWYRDTEVTMPVVASSSWLAPHGTVGIVFTNLGSDRFSFRYQFNTVDYGFGQDEQLLFRPLTPAATKTGQKLKSGLIEREEVLDSLGVSAYIIEAE